MRSRLRVHKLCVIDVEALVPVFSGALFEGIGLTEAVSEVGVLQGPEFKIIPSGCPIARGRVRGAACGSTREDTAMRFSSGHSGARTGSLLPFAGGAFSHVREAAAT
jgi:hypothetical protein